MLARRNQIGVMVKDVPLRLLIRHVFPIALEHVAGFLDTVRRRRPGAYVEVVRQVAPRLPGWLADRRRIQRGRLISVDELDAMLVGSGLAGRIGRRLRSR
jgi:hypothetical protein